MTEYLARVCARRPLVVIGIWLLVTVIGVAVNANFLESATTTEFRMSGSVESERASSRLEQKLRGPEPLIETVIVQSQVLTVDDAGFRSVVEGLANEISGLGSNAVTAVQHYYLQGDETLVSQDRRTTIIPVFLAGDLAQGEENVEHILEIVADANAAGDFHVLIVGTASISLENNELATHDLEQGERVGVPIALLILVALFGAVAAALVPIGLAIICIIAALGLVAIIGQTFELVFFVTLMVTMIGLAVGIDYSLLIISRFRDEMGRGLDKRTAVVRAGATAGRTVLFSGITVVIALLGLLIVPFSFFQSLALGAILVVLVALAATLTLLPAVLALMGPRVNFLPIPFFRRDRVEADSPKAHRRGFWEFITEKVTKFPIISVVAIGVPMLVASFFYFDIETGLNGVDTFPEGAQTRDAFFVMEKEFSFGLVNPTEVVIEGDINNPGVQAAIDELRTSLATLPSLQLLPGPVVNATGDLAVQTVIIQGEPRSQAAVDVVSAIRDEHIPAAFDGVDAEVLVGGVSAEAADVFSIVAQYTPIVFAFVLGFSFLILMLVFRSIVIPIKAVAMNLLSVGTAYGLLVLVFQKGVGTELLGFQHAEVVDVWIPLFLFSILFGLSMDYHVFLLSRIRERFDQTGDNAEAVAYGLRSTAGIITGAALIMVAVFGGFASGETIINQQVGFGLSVAVLLDATLVRSVLVPASMELLGKRNWYLPHWLNWLPDLRIEPQSHDGV